MDQMQLHIVPVAPEIERAELMKTHFANAQYWAARVPTLEGANKRAAIGACLGNLKAMLSVCRR